MSRTRTPAVLSVAGSDPSGGAGIQADLKTFSALGAYGGAVLTALTAQSTRGVTGAWPVAPAVVRAQLDAVLEDLDVVAVKTGMLGSAAVVEVVADAVRRHGVRHVVVDPVMVATSGDRLVDDDTIAATREALLPVSTLVTPNVPEAAVLTGCEPARDPDGLAAAAGALRSAGAGAALVKGGHLGGPESVDVLVDEDGEQRLAHPRVPTRNTHGTGCTLSSAVAAGLAGGLDLRPAVRRARAYLQGALGAADELCVGSGPGPVHHFHGWW